MKKIVIALLACVLGATAGHTQSTKAQLNTAITTTFIDNTVGAITPAGLRSVTSDIVNSIMPTAPVVGGNLACFNGTTGLLQDCGVAPGGIYTALSGDCTATSGGVITCTKTNNVAFSALATTVPGTGVAAALAIAVGSAGAPVVLNGALGTPSSGTLTNTTGFPLANLSGAGAGCLTFLGTPSSANLRTCVTDESGSGALLFQGGNLGTPTSGDASNLTALNASQLTTGTIPAARTNGHQNGTATNDNAAAGEVGELIDNTLASGSATSLTSGTSKDITTVSLTAGDWDISTVAYFIPTASTSVTYFAASISTTVNTFDNTPGRWGQWAGAAQVDSAANVKSQSAGPYRLSLSATTTVRLVAAAAFTASTMTAYGYIRARRMR